MDAARQIPGRRQAAHRSNRRSLRFSCLAYTEHHPDENTSTLVKFWRNAQAFFTVHSITPHPNSPKVSAMSCTTKRSDHSQAAGS